MRSVVTYLDADAARRRYALCVLAPLVIAALFATACLAGCRDPALEAGIAALGPEAAAVPIGPLHRPDQPCVLCHQAGGSASAFLVGGTIHFAEDKAQPVANVEVVLVDMKGQIHRTTSNCAGNFFVRAGEWTPTTPIWASLVAGEHTIHMESPIYREGSCAVCHYQPAGPQSAGHVFLSDDPLEPIALPPSPCPPGTPAGSGASGAR